MREMLLMDNLRATSTSHSRFSPPAVDTAACSFGYTTCPEIEEHPMADLEP